MPVIIREEISLFAICCVFLFSLKMVVAKEGKKICYLLSINIMFIKVSLPLFIRSLVKHFFPVCLLPNNLTKKIMLCLLIGP